MLFFSKLISDIETYQFIISTIRDGMTCKDYTEANNKLLISHKLNKTSLCIKCLGTNNPYGHSYGAT